MTMTTATSSGSDVSRQPERFTVHHRVPWKTLLAGGVFAAIVLVVGYELVTNPRMGWDTVGDYLFSEAILRGVGVTIQLTLLSLVCGVILGFLLAVAGASGNPVARTVNFTFIAVFRGTPLLVQLLIWYNLALFVPKLSLGIPFTDVSRSWDTNEVITGFTAALLGLALNEAAYMSEIFRGGFAAIPKGQSEAALGLGMRPTAVTFRIVLPQSIRVISPAVGNQMILLLKTTSLVAVIGGGDLLTQAQYIYGQNFKIIPLLVVVTIWYLALIAIAQIGQYYLERRFSGSHRRLSVFRRLTTGTIGRTN